MNEPHGASNGEVAVMYLKILCGKRYFVFDYFKTSKPYHYENAHFNCDPKFCLHNQQRTTSITGNLWRSYGYPTKRNCTYLGLGYFFTGIDYQCQLGYNNHTNERR